MATNFDNPSQGNGEKTGQFITRIDRGNFSSESVRNAIRPQIIDPNPQTIINKNLAASRKNNQTKISNVNNINVTPTPTRTYTPSVTITRTFTPTPTVTKTPTNTPTVTKTPTPTVTNTPTPTSP